MKKLVSLTIALVGLAFLVPGAIAKHDREWAFKILLDGKDVGSQRFRLGHEGDFERLETTASIKVKFLFATVYSYRHENVELWDGDCLAEIESSTESSRNSLSVDGTRNDEHFVVEGADGTQRLPGCVMSFAYWKPDFLEEPRLLNSQNGEYLEVDVAGPIDDDHTVKGESVPTQRYELSAKDIDIRLWYTRDRQWVALESKIKGNRTLRYELM